MATKKPRFMITFESVGDLANAKQLAKELSFRSLNALIMKLINDAIVDWDKQEEKENVTTETRS